MGVHLPFMQLREYLKANDITITAFAKKVNRSRITIDSYLTDNEARKKSPSPETLKRICEATEGQVRPDDFFPFCETTGQAPPGERDRGGVINDIGSSP